MTLQAHQAEQCLTVAFVARLIDKKNARRYDDCISYTMVSAKKALQQAGLEKESDAYEKLDKTKVCISLVSDTYLK